MPPPPRSSSYPSAPPPRPAPQPAPERVRKPTGNILIINAGTMETRVALVENGVVVEMNVERQGDRGFVGNIYKGRVIRVLPSMQAAFVDVGLEKAAFLYGGDVYEEGMAGVDADDEEDDDTEGDDEGADGPGASGAASGANGAVSSPGSAHSGNGSTSGGWGGGGGARARGGRRRPERRVKPIEEVLKDGQDIICQVSKDPIGTKGCRVTMHISLAGRHVVYMPHSTTVGISRRIEDERERERLRQLMDRAKPDKGGVIVRTVSEGINQKKLRYDVEILQRSWEEVRKKAQTAKSPALLRGDMSLAMRSARDLFTEDIDGIIIDDPEQHAQMVEFVAAYDPESPKSIELYEGDEPLFDHFRIEPELQRALSRRVWLKSGAYIVIDQAEALTAIDVNSGKFTGGANLEETILKTNLEAVAEIVYQIRLRNLGGIIIVDFIDMDRPAHRDKVYQAMREQVAKDKARTQVQPISGLGVLEMTRKRSRDSIGRTLCEPCFYCDGKGYLKSKTTVGHEVLREIQREAPTARNRVLVVSAHRDICDFLESEAAEEIARLEKRYERKIQFRSVPHFHIEHFEVSEKPWSPPPSGGRRH